MKRSGIYTHVYIQKDNHLHGVGTDVLLSEILVLFTPKGEPSA